MSSKKERVYKYELTLIIGNKFIYLHLSKINSVISRIEILASFSNIWSLLITIPQPVTSTTSKEKGLHC